MLGPLKTRRVDRPVLAALEALVPPEHFYRHLARGLDLSFVVRPGARARSLCHLRPSLAPVMLFQLQLQLILFFEGLRSERHLLAMASLNLAHRWHLGHALDEPLPDHSTLRPPWDASANSRGFGRHRRHQGMLQNSDRARVLRPWCTASSDPLG
jgi:hypothetical protein